MSQDFSQLGIGIATLVILWIVVKYFINAINKKDDYISQITHEFNKTIQNHLQHETSAFNEMTQAIKELTKEIKRNGKH